MMQAEELLAQEYVDPRSLVTPRRYDLAVKWRFFRHLLAPENGLIHGPATDNYQWHIWRRQQSNAELGIGMDRGKDTLDYVYHAEQLFNSMRDGYNVLYSVPVDRFGELLDGAHRVACAIALGVDEIPIERRPQTAWAPPWDLQWFIDNGMPEADLERLKSDFEEMQRG